jgi:uncharacterized protein
MRIDAFAHLLPEQLRRAVLDAAPPSAPLVNWASLEPLYDLDRRLAALDGHSIDHQFTTTPSPPLETLFDVATTRRMAELANDGMAKAVRELPHRLGGVATVPLVDPRWAIEELRRSVLDLGLAGPLVYTHVQGRALDHPDFEPFWSEAEALDVPVWLHPDRALPGGDYAGEPESRYGLFLVLGWPYETSVAIARLVLSGVMARHPSLKVIVHHGGAMIPSFHRRIEMNFVKGAQGRVPDLEDDSVDVARDLRNFYVDTVLQGAAPALEASIAFYGRERVLFATDMPFGPGQGTGFTEASVRSVEQLDPGIGEAIFGGNARELFHIEQA